MSLLALVVVALLLFLVVVVMVWGTPWCGVHYIHGVHTHHGSCLRLSAGLAQVPHTVAVAVRGRRVMGEMMLAGFSKVLADVSDEPHGQKLVAVAAAAVEEAHAPSEERGQHAS